MEPILSICIPTYNRSGFLKQALDSIVSQPVFIESNDIEVVVCDNCSTDDTSQQIKPYLEKYKNKIIYIRNSENILDKNFSKVLSLGSGQFLKLMNDTLIIKDGSLTEILNVVKKALDEKPVLFFANGNSKQKKRISSFPSFEEFFKNASFHVTWIGSFGIWRSDYERINDFNRASNLNLIQVDVLFRLFEWNKKSVIDNNIYFISITPPKKGGYDLITVFADNYFQLLKVPVTRGDLSIKSYNREKKKMLVKFFIPWLIRCEVEHDKYHFGITDWGKRLQRYYTGVFRFYLIYFKFMKFCYKIYYLLYKKKKTTAVVTGG